MTMRGTPYQARLRRLMCGLLTVTAALLLATALLYWSWNTALAEVFGAPALEPRSALALVLLAGLLRAITWSQPRRHITAGAVR